MILLKDTLMFERERGNLRYFEKDGSGNFPIYWLKHKYVSPPVDLKVYLNFNNIAGSNYIRFVSSIMGEARECAECKN